MLINGFKLGQVTDRDNATGCTVVLCEEGAVCGVDVRGGASTVLGVEEGGPFHLVKKAHGVVLTGGSAYGLESVFGVMKYLEERGVGFSVGPTVVPIVLGAVLFDLHVGSSLIRPGREWGFRACERASAKVEEGCVGAGTGATVGKILGRDRSMKGGLGVATEKVGEKVEVQAVMAVNALGDVWDFEENRILAGVRNDDGSLANALELLKGGVDHFSFNDKPPQNTTIGVVMTNAALEKWEANRLAQWSHNGLAWAVRPCHTSSDGDSIFVLSRGEEKVNLNCLAAASQVAVARAIGRAVRMADSLAGVPAI